MSQKRPKGGRPARNFDPRYAKSTGRKRSGGPSRNHRGYREEDTETPRKNRLTPEQREGRAQAKAIRDHARSGRRSAPFEPANKRPRTQTAQRDSRGDRERERPVKPRSASNSDDVVHERLRAKAVQATDVAEVSFADMGLGSNITETLANMGAHAPFPIQAATIPAILEGRDVLGRGRTGSGKTIAFGAPLVEAVLRSQAGQKRQQGRAPSAIILAPTRELALQIDRTVQPIARSVGLFTTQIYGGVPQARQVGALKKGVDIIIGTPGRIEDLVEQRKLNLSHVQIAVLDEGDHMCELGFIEPVQRILRKTRDDSQKLLFSATLDREVESLVNEFLVDPAVFEVAGEDQDSGTIDHRVLVVEHRDKADILASLVDREGRTLVFSRTRAYTEMLTEQFIAAGVPAVALHGDLTQAKRTRNLAKFTSGKVDVLVATDVAARGIHVDDIDLVVQADAPDEYKTYLHRAGRTGRAGREGTVVTLVGRARRRKLGDLLSRAEITAPFVEARPGDDMIDEIAGRMTLAMLTA